MLLRLAKKGLNDEIQIKVVGTENVRSEAKWGPGVRDVYIIHYVLTGKGYFNGKPVKKDQGFFIKANDPDGVWKIFQGINNAFVYVKIHRAVTPAFGFLHQLQIAGGAEFTAEIAGIAGVNVDHIGCPQRQRIFQFHPVVDVNSGDVFCFHGMALISFC